MYNVKQEQKKTGLFLSLSLSLRYLSCLPIYTRFAFSLFFFSFCLYVCKTSIFCERINYQLTNVRSQCVLSIRSRLRRFFFLYMYVFEREKVIDKYIQKNLSFFLSSRFFLFGRETREIDRCSHFLT